MDEQSIQDHGNATLGDAKRMVVDIGSLDLSLDLMGVLRQLVGVDMLREQEVFYVPTHGVQPSVPSLPQKEKRRGSLRHPGKTSTSKGLSTLGARRSTGDLHEVLRRAPNSASTSSSVEPLRFRANASTKGSPPNSDAEGSDSPRRPTKRQRKNPAAVAQTNEMAPPALPSEKEPAKSSRVLRSRRSKRLSKDAAAYNPLAQEEEESTDEELESLKARQPKVVDKRGVKRARAEQDGQPEAPTTTRKRNRTGAKPIMKISSFQPFRHYDPHTAGPSQSSDTVDGQPETSKTRRSRAEGKLEAETGAAESTSSKPLSYRHFNPFAVRPSRSLDAKYFSRF